ncbi:hypothetical protein Tco_1077262 [Tanacetum coccineum]
MIGTLLYLTDSSRPNICSYADVDHAGCQVTRQSTFGSMQLLGDRLVRWSSKRQKSAAISSTEAEYIALSGCYFTSLKEQLRTVSVELYFVNEVYQLADNLLLKALAEKELNFLSTS